MKFDTYFAILQLILDGDTVVENDGRHKSRKRCSEHPVEMYSGLTEVKILHIHQFPGNPQLEVTYRGPDTYYEEVHTPKCVFDEALS